MKKDKDAQRQAKTYEDAHCSLYYDQRIDELTNGYLIRLIQCYRPHTEPQLGERIEHISHCNIRSIGEEVDYQWPKKGEDR